MNLQQIPGPLGEHQVFRTLNKLPIHWRGRRYTHACEGSDIHPGVRLLWTRCEIDVPANGAYLPHPPSEAPVTCPRCNAAEGP